MDNVLEIRSLCKSYGKTQALKGVSFDIPRGKIVGLLGPNGSGKTTIIKIVMGLLSDYSGEVRLLSGRPGHRANANISYLPDVSHIPAWLTVEQAIGLFADFYCDFDGKRAHEMLDGMKISTAVKIQTLSRGMREKVQLALVMSRRAKLYVLDEPIGAVDPASREFIIDTIIRNYSGDSSILLSTHIIADIEPILDIAIFLKDGVVVLHEDADKIREDNGNSIDRLFREVFRNVH